MYRLIKQEGRAKRGELTTVHGTIQTPVFMNVGTVAAIKGAVSTEDLEQIKTQVQLSNTYHLHVRPGDKLIKEMGDSIHEGKIPALPALGPNHSTTCEWCDYNEVCLREKGEYRYIDNLKHDDALRIISGGEDSEDEMDV